MYTNALCNKSNGRCDIKAEKREELESKSSHKSDIWPPAASKKWGEIYWKYIFQTLEAIFPYKGVFVTKVVKANIIAFTKPEILRPVLFVTNPPFQKCQPLLHSALLLFSSQEVGRGSFSLEIGDWKKTQDFSGARIGQGTQIIIGSWFSCSWGGKTSRITSLPGIDIYLSNVPFQLKLKRSYAGAPE